MSELKVSVSGIRGVWADSLTLETLRDYTQAFARYIRTHNGSKILMGRDARPTGKMIAAYCASILNAMGVTVIDTGIVPTPTVLFGVRKNNLAGGIIITASHNPVEWNALKFVKKGGVFTGEADLAEIKGYLGQPIREAAYNRIGECFMDDQISDAHIEAVLKHVDRDAIAAKNFVVVLDPVNSAGSLIGQWLLIKLGCKVKVVNGEMTGRFERGTEPTPQNLTHLEAIVREAGADIGFAQDPDADRLVLIDETGKVLSEELTLALAVEAVLSKKKGDVVINMSTSRVIEEIAKRHGCKTFRTKVGEANVVEGIEGHKAVIGGEGNGGVIYPAINIGRDSLVGIGLVLELMAKRGKKLSELVAELPKMEMIKEKFEVKGDFAKLLPAVRAAFPDAGVNDLDGLRFDFPDRWVHVRASNTEPVVRIIGEGSDTAALKADFEKIGKIVRG
jgi:phosphomannomutase